MANPILRACGALALTLVVGACAERLPSAPTAGAPSGPELQRLNCVARVRTAQVTCSAPGALPEGARGVILGGQGTYVRLASDSVAYDSVTQAFSFRVTVTSLFPQPLGTTDGVTPAPEGVRVFFGQAPVTTAGTGTITVSNADGSAIFISGTPSPYFQYDEVLQTNQTSAPKRWVFDVPTTVETFAFTLFVSAPVPHSGQWMDMATGFGHTCALAWEGHAYCWGRNDLGQLGGSDAELSRTPVAVQQPANVLFRQITAGQDHTCALATSGTVYCWGSNDQSALGSSVEGYSSTPVPASLPAAVTKIGARHNSTCALTVSGVVYCWGPVIGFSASTGYLPRAVPLQPGLSLTTLSVGWFHFCGLDAGGQAWCWGGGTSGQLGTGVVNTSARDTAVAVVQPTGVVFDSITAGESHTCATAAGQAYCWGMNTYGALGDGTRISRSLPITVHQPAGVSLVDIEGGDLHTCALSSGGQGYCWGYNPAGGVGDGGNGDRLVPSAVHQPVSVSLERIIPGVRHTCGITTTGTGYCWGYNQYGQLGNGTVANSFTPVAVAGPG